MSRPAPSCEREHRQPHRAREPERDHADPEPGDDDEELRPCTTTDRVAGDQERRNERAHGRRSAEEPEAGRTDLEDVLREDRQERDGAAEEHREEIERDRAEQDVRPPNEANARHHLVEPHDTLGRRDPTAPKGQHAAERDQRQRDCNCVDELRLDREEEAADCGAHHRRQLERDRSLCERAHQDLLRHERWRERPAGGRTDCASDPLHESQGEERPHPLRARCRHGKEPNEDDHVERHHHREQVPAGHAVGQLAGGQREEEQRQELGEPDEPEVQRVLAYRVDLPPDRDERHLQRERLGDERHPEEREVAVPERGSAAATHVTNLGRSRLVSGRFVVHAELDLDLHDP